MKNKTPFLLLMIFLGFGLQSCEKEKKTEQENLTKNEIVKPNDSVKSVSVEKTEKQIQYTITVEKIDSLQYHSEKKKTAPKKEEAPVSMQDLYTGTAPKAAKANATSAKKEMKANNAYRFLVKPLVTEKATDLMAQNKYVFVVSEEANKIEIAKAIEALYGVKPLKVNLSNVKGKKVSRGRIRGQRKDWRKAVVTLPAGQTIKIYEGV